MSKIVWKLVLILILLLTSIVLALINTRTFGQELYPVTLQAVDSRGAPLKLPVLFLVVGYSDLCRCVHPVENGSITISLVPGQWPVSVSVFGRQVGNTTITVSDGPVVAAIPTRTFSLIVRFPTVTPQEIPVRVKAVYATDSLPQNVTSSLTARFDQLPAGLTTLLAYDQVNRTVAASTYDLEGDSKTTLTLGQYTPFHIVVVDATNATVTGALAITGSSSTPTDQFGTATIYVPSGQTNLTVTYQGIGVYSGILSANTPNETWAIAMTSIGPLKLAMTDETGKPLQNTLVRITEGGWQTSNSTDSNGILSYTQLPYGILQLQALQGPAIPLIFPTAQQKLQLLTHSVNIIAQVASAYMLGYVTILVTANAGNIIVKDITVKSSTGTVMRTSTGAIIQIPVGLDSQVVVTVTTIVYGTTSTRQVIINPSPIIPLTMPLSLLPIIIWRLMISRYKRKRPPLT
jgi:hypothetical protein